MQIAATCFLQAASFSARRHCLFISCRFSGSDLLKQPFSIVFIRSFWKSSWPQCRPFFGTPPLWTMCSHPATLCPSADCLCLRRQWQWCFLGSSPYCSQGRSLQSFIRFLVPSWTVRQFVLAVRSLQGFHSRTRSESLPLSNNKNRTLWIGRLVFISAGQTS